MRSVGIIVEYNPFHNGHIYHIQQAKEKTNADVVIAVMSGNFMQRGVPASMDKWQRTKAALEYVDIVIELPVSVSVQAADYFAKGAVEILGKMKCETLVFGTEVYSEGFDYATFGKEFEEAKEEIENLIRTFEPKEMAYPQKMTQIIKQKFPNVALDALSPNHILGLSYAKANATLKKPMKIMAIKRNAIGYHEKAMEKSYASATGIRLQWEQNNFTQCKPFVPLTTLQEMTSQTPITWTQFFPFLKYKIESETHVGLQKIYQMREGIEYRMKEVIHKSTSFDAFIDQVSTKRYTKTSLARLCCYILGGMTKEEITKEQQQAPITVLGFTNVGQQYLKSLKKECNFRTNYTKDNPNLYLTQKMDAIYQLATNQTIEQNIGREVIRVDKTNE